MGGAKVQKTQIPGKDIVAPAKATLLAHSDLAPTYPAEAGYLPYGTLRSAAGTPAGGIFRTLYPIIISDHSDMANDLLSLQPLSTAESAG